MVKVPEGLRVSNAIFTSPFDAVRRHASVAWKAAERQGSKTDPESWQILCDMLIAVLFLLLLLLGDPMHWPLRSSDSPGPATCPVQLSQWTGSRDEFWFSRFALPISRATLQTPHILRAGCHFHIANCRPCVERGSIMLSTLKPHTHTHTHTHIVH